MNRNTVKSLLFFGILMIAFLIAKSGIGSDTSQQQPRYDYLEPGLYLVVGVFEFERNAEKYTEYLKNSGKDTAEYAFYPPRNYFYVHLGKYKSYSSALKDLEVIRSEEGFDEAWLYNAGPYTMPGKPEADIVAAKANTSEPEKNIPETDLTENVNEQNNEIVENSARIDQAEEKVETTEDSQVEIAQASEPENEETKEFEGFKIYLNTIRKVDFKEIDGKVEVVDPDKVRMIKLVETHKLDTIDENFNRSGNIEMICEIFGYKKVQHDFNIRDPFQEKTEPFLSYEDDSTLVVDFKLERYTVGDLVTMYNVYFYKDAAIMRPESQYEINQLVEMLKENPKYEIMIHGHTNGNASGPIITMADGSEQYFSRSGPTNEGRGSAKKLSQERADVMRRYLIKEGISEARMEAKGWGGKKAIYKKLDPLAYKNVRVEIEILAE